MVLTALRRQPMTRASSPRSHHTRRPASLHHHGPDDIINSFPRMTSNKAQSRAWINFSSAPISHIDHIFLPFNECCWPTTLKCYSHFPTARASETIRPSLYMNPVVQVDFLQAKRSSMRSQLCRDRVPGQADVGCNESKSF